MVDREVDDSSSTVPTIADGRSMSGGDAQGNTIEHTLAGAAEEYI